MPAIYPFPRFRDFTQWTPTIPAFYWDVYSQEERIKALCREYAKLIAFTDSMVDTVNAQYDIVRTLQEEFPELVSEAIQPALDEYTESGALRVYVDEQLDLLKGRMQAAEDDIDAMQLDLREFGGATATAGGYRGLVPAPSAGDEQKFLCAAGTWETVGGGGGGGAGVDIEVNGSRIGTAATLNLIEGTGIDIGATLAGTTIRTTLAFDAAGAGLATVATSGSYDDLTDKPVIPAAVQADWTETDPASAAYIENKPNLSAVATSGSYNDLTDKPTIVTPVQSNWSEADTASLAYIRNRPAVDIVPTPNSAALITSGGVASALENVKPGGVIGQGTRVLAIGDSFLQGYASEGTQENWGDIMAAITGATVTKVAEGGIGWATAGQQGHRFADLVDSGHSVLGDAVDVVIIAGGYNDSMAEATSADIAAGAGNCITKIRNYWPDAEVYLFPNIWGNGAKSDGRATYGYPDEENAKAIKSTAFQITSGKPVSVVMGCWTWLYANMTAGICSSDGVHPLTPGQAIIAHSMLQAISGQDPTVYYSNWFGSGMWLMRTYLDVMIQLNGVSSSATLPTQYYLTQAAAAVGSGSGNAHGLWLLQQGRNISVYNGAGTNVWGSMFSRMSTSRY